mmetsp:Transcript_40180/g.87645  ORF Transcript_40180/g.87645 Transcript_40180/m.87645 type:complete len:202 (+) Transcript_40180:938-1543(+)
MSGARRQGGRLRQLPVLGRGGSSNRDPAQVVPLRRAPYYLRVGPAQVRRGLWPGGQCGQWPGDESSVHRRRGWRSAGPGSGGGVCIVWTSSGLLRSAREGRRLRDHGPLGRCQGRGREQGKDSGDVGTPREGRVCRAEAPLSTRWVREIVTGWRRGAATPYQLRGPGYRPGGRRGTEIVPPGDRPGGRRGTEIVPPGDPPQ